MRETPSSAAAASASPEMSFRSRLSLCGLDRYGAKAAVAAHFDQRLTCWSLSSSTGAAGIKGLAQDQLRVSAALFWDSLCLTRSLQKVSSQTPEVDKCSPGQLHVFIYKATAPPPLHRLECGRGVESQATLNTRLFPGQTLEDKLAR